MKQHIDTQYPFGLPATATVDFIKALAAGDTITVNGTVYTYGTSFSSGALNRSQDAAAFAAAVNGAPDGYGEGSIHTISKTIGDVFAVYYGSRVTLTARVPGTGGNSFTLATSVSSKVVISGATFSGGSTGYLPPTLGTSAGATRISSSALEKSHVLKSSAGTLIALIGFHTNTSGQFIQVHNAATLPADAEVPILTFGVKPYDSASPESGNFSCTIPITGLPFSTGIVVCSSSTLATKTLGGTSDCWFVGVVI